MRLPRLNLFGALALLFAPLAWGADVSEPGMSAEADVIVIDTIRARLSLVDRDLEIARILPTPLVGLYLVELKRQGFLYATGDGQYLIEGDMYRVLDAGTVVNLTDARRNVLRREMLSAVSRDEMIVFAPEGEVRAVLSVFTDVDCGYCRKLHKEMPRLNEFGIEVRYLAYPRSGVGTASYDKMVTAWCSEDPQDAITRLKLGQELAALSCDSPVAAQYELGQSIGVRGTPALILESGEMLPGYLPAHELAKRLGVGDG